MEGVGGYYSTAQVVDLRRSETNTSTAQKIFFFFFCDNTVESAHTPELTDPNRSYRSVMSTICINFEIMSATRSHRGLAGDMDEGSVRKGESTTELGYKFAPVPALSKIGGG